MRMKEKKKVWKGFYSISSLMSKPTQREVLSLYRSYLRIIKEWPEDKIRPNRGMKQVLAKKVQEQFRSPQTLDYYKAKEEMKALDYLLDNKFQEKVA